MWYQANVKVADDKEQGRKYSTHIAYAESKDGVTWKLAKRDAMFLVGRLGLTTDHTDHTENVAATHR